jgi:hypothetical protein
MFPSLSSAEQLGSQLPQAQQLVHDIPTEVFGRAYLEVRAGYFTH